MTRRPARPLAGPRQRRGDSALSVEDPAVLYTGSRVKGSKKAVGSVCTICALDAATPRVWRLMDAAGSDVKLAAARRVTK